MNKRLNHCNIIHETGEAATLWSFSYKNRKPALAFEKELIAGEIVTQQAVVKDWKTFFNPTLNIAWLPSSEVYIRVIQLPTDDPSEVADMLELQLEKLSPVPLGQIVWSHEILPSGNTNSITAVVVLVDRKAVDHLLGDLESRGFLADRLVVPQLERLKATGLELDGVYVFPEKVGEQQYCLVVWVFNQTVYNVSFLHLDSGANWHKMFRREVRQIQWSGEVEGWLDVRPDFYLIADGDWELEWGPVLEDLGDFTVLSEKALEPGDLANFEADRAQRGGQQANLLPGDYSQKYNKRVQSALWMKGISVAFVLYLLFLVAHFIYVGNLKNRRENLDQQIAGISGSYTNAVKLNEQIKVLKRQEQLKFAALDCWKAVVEVLPSELSFTSFNFDVGNRLTLTGTASVSANAAITNYREQLESVRVGDKLLFSSVEEKSGRTTRNSRITWTFECTINEPESR